MVRTPSRSSTGGVIGPARAGSKAALMGEKRMDSSTTADRAAIGGPFHLAFPVHDLASTRAFYGEVLGCAMGRSAPTWQDFDFFGHQLSAHVTPGATAAGEGSVGGEAVPIPHFGIVLDMPTWRALAKRVEAAGTAFLRAPNLRFAGEPGEQGTFFLRDPSGNAIEFKGFASAAAIFATGGGTATGASAGAGAG